MADQEKRVIGDRYSLNLAAESVSNVLSFIGGVVSTAILWRATVWGSWSISEYGIAKVLTNAGLLLFPFIILGTTSAASRVYAELSLDRTKLGQAIVGSFLIVIATSTSVILFALAFRLDLLLLGKDIGGILSASELALLWTITVVTLLPSAFLTLVKSAFQGLQVIRRTLLVDISYNIVRVAALVYLAFNLLINLYTVLFLNLALGVFAACFALLLFSHDIRRHEIPINWKLDASITGRILRLAALFFVASLAGVGLNNLTVIWMNFYGTLENVGYYTIANGVVVTVSAVLSSPLIAMTPNLTVEYAKGRLDEVSRKFREAYKMMIPTLSFAFAVLFTFAAPILRILYSSTGVAATFFLQLMAFNVYILVSATYSYLYVALDDRKGFLLASTQQIIFPVIWVVVVTPMVGVPAIAMIWVAWIPYFFIQYRYCRKKHHISMDLKLVAGGVAMGLIFAAVMSILEAQLQNLVGHLPFLPIVQAGIVGLVVFPMWYVYIAASTWAHLIDATDFRNMEKVLRVFPPAWWLTRPLFNRLKNAADRGQDREG